MALRGGGQSHEGTGQGDVARDGCGGNQSGPNVSEDRVPGLVEDREVNAVCDEAECSTNQAPEQDQQSWDSNPDLRIPSVAGWWPALRAAITFTFLRRLVRVRGHGNQYSRGA